MIELRDYQIDISRKGAKILSEKKIVYLSMQVRTGKSLTALEICRIVRAKKVLFLTKKKAIESIVSDYYMLGPGYHLEVINDEQLPNIADNDYDVVIHDEHHRFGAFPKTGKYTKLFKQLFGNKHQIYLSGTPTPESYSQIFHQFWVSNYSPFRQYSNFYNWAKTFVNVTKRRFAHGEVNDYSDAKYNLIEPIIKPYMLTFTQQEAGFKSTIDEEILYCDMMPHTYETCKLLMKDRVVEHNFTLPIIADTPVKLMQKLHQLYSGTVKFEDGSYEVLDYSKALFIKDQFKGKKIGIFYKFVAELECLKAILKDDLTTDIDEFNNSNKNIALQIVSGREGISLRNAEALVFYNIDFSATSYWQGRDRMTTKDRLFSKVYWIFSKGGIEDKIYKAVMDKKSYTLNIFKKDYGK
jgi:hypothetical protein